MSIHVRSLSKRYGKSWAVRDLSFEVRPGRVTGFLGPNGAGKSTTMRSIVGLDTPTSGEALVAGQRYARLHLTVPSVKTHVNRILAKLHARDRVHLVIIAYERGFAGR